MTQDIYRFETKGDDLYIGGHKVLKGLESYSGWFWFVTEYTDEHTWFGFVQGFEEEWGYIDKREIEEQIKKGSVWEIPKENLTISGRRH